MVGKRSARAGSSVGRKKRARTDDADASYGAEECTAHINAAYLNEAFMTSLKANLTNKKPFEDESGAKMFHEPFTHFILPDFLAEEKFVDMLEKQLRKLPFRLKSNDLFTFLQSGDLNAEEGTYITPLKHMLEQKFHKWLEDITGNVFNDKVDMFCSKYRDKDVLLCHDDELEERKIAYILYLVPSDWQREDGGALQLFSTDENGDAEQIVKSIVPKRNCMAFFEVSPNSWHQVEEVLCADKTRLTVTGWFTGSPLKRPLSHVSPPGSPLPYSSIQEDDFYAWINPTYVDPETQRTINQKFEELSEIQLHDFLQREKYEELVEALRAVSRWTQQGPPNKRWYLSCELDDRPPIVQSFVQFLQSDALFLVLSIMTGLKLHEDAPDSDTDSGSQTNGPSTSQATPSRSGAKAGRRAKHKPKKVCTSRCLTKVRKWRHGGYTLCYDSMAQLGRAKFALDAIFYLGCEDWDTEKGGFTSYIAKDEKEELLRVVPTANCLALVYREKDTLRFVKHVTHDSLTGEHPEFFDVSTVYFE